MIKVDESDPVGEIAPKFPYRDVTIKRNTDVKEFYELITQIGRGKFGTVFKCREKETGIELAAKFIPIPKREDRRNVERETHMMNTLRHEKILQLYDAYEYNKNMCVVMELVEGGELFDRVLDNNFELSEKACSIFVRQICEAMNYIHENNIIHLDLKPENILCLTREGNRIKIIDFGLAREYDPDKKLQVLFGTPEFVAPEVVNFDSIGVYTDMWSVGVISYVLVSGLSPFAGETDVETMANVTIGKYDFDDDAFIPVSTDAQDFITRLLRKDPKDRMTASEALGHRWVRRKPQYYPTRKNNNTITSNQPMTNNTLNLDTTKENLKNSIDRWNDNGNSLSPPSSLSPSSTPTPDFLKCDDEFEKTNDDFIISSHFLNNNNNNNNICSSSSPINHSFNELDNEILMTPGEEAEEEEEKEVVEEESSCNGNENEELKVEVDEQHVDVNDNRAEMKMKEETVHEISNGVNINEPEQQNGHENEIEPMNEDVEVEIPLAEPEKIPSIIISPAKEKPQVPEKPQTLKDRVLKQASNGNGETDLPKTNGHSKPEVKEKPDFLKNYKPTTNIFNRTYKMSQFSSSLETTTDSALRRTNFHSTNTKKLSLQETNSNGHVNTTTIHHGFSDKMNECIEATSNMFREALSSQNSFSDYDEELETNVSSNGSGGVPWPITSKRTKFRVCQMSRDVPFGSPSTRDFNLANDESVTSTKGCLLHILERFNDTTRSTMTRDQSQFTLNIEKNLSTIDWGLSDSDSGCSTGRLSQNKHRDQQDLPIECDAMNSINAFFHHRTSDHGKTVKQKQAQLEAKSKF